MRKKYQYGHNFGNESTEGVARLDGEVFGWHALLSVSAPVSDANFQQARLTSISEANDNPINVSPMVLVGPFDQKEHYLVFKGKRTCHGQKALGMLGATSGAGDANRYWDDDGNLPALLNCSAIIIPEDEYELDVVTHLPTDSYTPANVEKVINALSGDHTFEHDGRQRRAIVRVLRVLYEGGGVLVVHGSKDRDADQLVLDTGWETTNVFRTKGTTPILPLCKSFRIGMKVTAQFVNDQAAADYKGYTFSAANIRRLLIASTGIPRMNNVPLYPDFSVYGEKIPAETLHRWVLNARKSTVALLKPELRTTLKTNEQGVVAADIKVALYSGGGAYSLFDEVKVGIIPHLERPEEAEYADTHGFARLAQAIVKKQQAEMQKSA